MDVRDAPRCTHQHPRCDRRHVLGIARLRDRGQHDPLMMAIVGDIELPALVAAGDRRARLQRFFGLDHRCDRGGREIEPHARVVLLGPEPDRAIAVPVLDRDQAIDGKAVNRERRELDHDDRGLWLGRECGRGAGVLGDREPLAIRRHDRHVARHDAGHESGDAAAPDLERVVAGAMKRNPAGREDRIRRLVDHVDLASVDRDAREPVRPVDQHDLVRRMDRGELRRLGVERIAQSPARRSQDQEEPQAHAR